MSLHASIHGKAADKKWYPLEVVALPSGGYGLTGMVGEKGTLAATDVNGALTLIDSAIDVSNYNVMFIDVLAGAAALTDFDVLISADGSYYHTILSVTGDYTTPTNFLKAASGDLTALGGSSHGWLWLDVSGINSIQLKAQAAATSEVSVSWSAN